ncbi:MAG: DUF3592 domain-containing protein [Pirellulales bacterium]
MDATTAEEFSPPPALSEPPRYVPTSLRIGLLFGGFLNQFGWFFFGFGMIFYWVFAANADFESLYFLGDLETASGVVTSAETLNFEVNDRKVRKFGYKFTVDGVERHGESYSTSDNIAVGSRAKIEFPAGNPDRSRIVGGTSSPMPIWCLFVIIFPLVGMIFFTIGFRQGRRVGRLLAEGVASVGKLVNQEQTSTRINNRPVVRFHYEFPASDGNIYAATASTHLVETLADEQQPLLYDPANPGDATLLAHLPCRPQIDEMGQLRPLAVNRVLMATFIPAISILGHGGVAIWRLVSL